MKTKQCPLCKGEGKYWYELSIEELNSLANMGGTTNYNPNYMKECEKCKGKGRIGMIKHYIKKRNYSYRYLCNGACSITKEKSTRNIKEVTCKNCIRKLK